MKIPERKSITSILFAYYITWWVGILRHPPYNFKNWTICWLCLTIVFYIIGILMKPYPLKGKSRAWYLFIKKGIWYACILGSLLPIILLILHLFSGGIDWDGYSAFLIVYSFLIMIGIQILYSIFILLRYLYRRFSAT